jgi:ribosomal protein L7Ae-like RNA K-turn-binding protein
MATSRPTVPPKGDPGGAVLGLLGLGLRSRGVVVGVEATRAALQRGGAAMVVIARDASERATETVVRLAGARGIPVVGGPTAREIGERLGRPPVMTVAVTDRHLARGIRAATTGPDGS